MADQDGGFLKGAYDLEGSDATIGFYGDWAASYEAEIKDNGYATPQRCAAALTAQEVDRNAPLLDLGCGTGLSGEAFRAAGFTTIDGTDFSPEMLAYAQAKPELYRALTLADLTNPIPAQPGAYASIAAVGVISPGHAPAEMIDQVLALLPAGGHFVFSLNDHALEDPSFRGHIAAAIEAGTAELRFEEYGAHLPGIDLKAVVFVLQKL